MSVHHLKAMLAKADPASPPPCLVSLLSDLHGQDGGLAELSDEAEIPWAQLEAAGVGVLTYIVRRSPDLMAMLMNMRLTSFRGMPPPAPPPVQAHQLAGIAVAPPPTTPPLLSPPFPQVLFHEPFFLAMEEMRWRSYREQTRSEFWAALRFGLLNLSAEEANQVQHDGMTVLIGMSRLCCVVDDDGKDVEDYLEPMTLEFLKREDLNIEMINSVVNMDWWWGAPARGLVSAMLLSLRAKKFTRGGRSMGGGAIGIAHQIMVILAARAPEELGCVTSDFFCDTMLHHTLEPASLRHSSDKSEGEALFCLDLVGNMNLAQLCHLNREGICALSYAEQFVANAPGYVAWQHVPDAMEHRMKRLSYQITSVPELLTHVRMMEQAVGSAIHCDLETTRLKEVVLTMRDVAHALQFRALWLSRGWYFQTRAISEQVNEVILWAGGDSLRRWTELDRINVLSRTEHL